MADATPQAAVGEGKPVSAATTEAAGANSAATAPVTPPAEPARAETPAPAPSPHQPRRALARKTSRATAKDRAAYMRSYRARKAEAEVKASAPTPQEAAAEAEAAAAEAARIKALEAKLSEAISGTLALLTDSVQAFALDPNKPHFGKARADKVAGPWAELLAPHVNEQTADKLPVVLAIGVTLGTLYDWKREYDNAPAPVKPAPAEEPAE
jgi:hypothetical protein